MTHGKDVLVAEWSGVWGGIPFAKNSGHYKLNRLETTYRIPNRRLASVAKSFISEDGSQKEMSDWNQKLLNFEGDDRTIIVASGCGWITLFLLIEVNHRISSDRDYFQET